MKKIILLANILFIVTIHNVQSQQILGKWKAIDDETQKPRSIIEIYEKSGKIYGKVVEILEPGKENNLCTECSGEDKNKPILGMVILKGLQKDKQEYSGGFITDPATGKKYKCTISLEAKNILKVRGYIGFSLIGRTQYWQRAR